MMKCSWILISLMVFHTKTRATFYAHQPLIPHLPLVYVYPFQPYPIHDAGLCRDIHGQWVQYGGLFFDGIYWKICGMNRKVKPGYGILERKWQVVFRMLDTNRDGILSSADEALMTKMFTKHFGLTGPMAEPVRRAVSLIWRLLLVHKATKVDTLAQMTEPEFIRHLWNSYNQRRNMLFTTIMKIADLLLFVTDNNKDGHISFPEWEILLNVLGCNDQRAAHFMFKFTQPNYWGYSTIHGVRQLIMNLIFDQDPHYFFKFESILEATGLVPSSKKVEVKPITKQVLKQNTPQPKTIDNGNSLIDSEIQHLLFQMGKPKK